MDSLAVRRLSTIAGRHRFSLVLCIWLLKREKTLPNPLSSVDLPSVTNDTSLSVSLARYASGLGGWCLIRSQSFTIGRSGLSGPIPFYIPSRTLSLGYLDLFTSTPRPSRATTSYQPDREADVPSSNLFATRRNGYSSALAASTA